MVLVEPEAYKKRQWLNNQEDGNLVEALILSSKLGWPCGTDDIQLMVKWYLDSQEKQTVFKNSVPGKDWLIAFKQHWSAQLSL